MEFRASETETETEVETETYSFDTFSVLVEGRRGEWLTFFVCPLPFLFCEFSSRRTELN